MISKRALTNISNVNNDKSGQKAVKRTLDLSPNKCLKKKNKYILNDKNGLEMVGKTNENNGIEKNTKNCQTITDPTLSIERKVKAINISSKSKSLSPKIQELIEKTKPEVFETNDESFDAKTIDFSDPNTYYCPPIDIPDNIEDFDKSQLKTIESEPHYAMDIFLYYKRRELKTSTKKYLQIQPELTKGMRSVLVDWMVEVQESFE